MLSVEVIVDLKLEKAELARNFILGLNKNHQKQVLSQEQVLKF